MSVSNWVKSWFGLHKSKRVTDEISDVPHKVTKNQWQLYKSYKESLKSKLSKYNIPVTYNSYTSCPKWEIIKKDVQDVLIKVSDHFIYTSEKADNWDIPFLNDGYYYNDCDGFATLVKSELILKGLKPEWLSLVTCFIDRYDFDSYHMGLFILCDDGTMYCDNISKTNVYRWYDTGYKYDFMEYKSGFARINN